LAKRQTHINILIIATEAANQAAWKNELLLEDLLEGLYQAVGNTAAQQSQSQSSQQQQQQQQSVTLAPFRSVTKSLHLDWSDINVTFCQNQTLAQAPTDIQAAKSLAAHAVLQVQDGNLEYEMELLQDQVDNLLQDNNNTSGNNNSSGSGNNSNDDPMNWYQDRQRQLEQVTKDAFALTSPLTIPWLWRYRQALDASTAGLQHDLTSCPAIVLTVCTTQESLNPVETLKALQSPHYLPLAFHNGLLDPRTVRYEALVLHDNVEGPADTEWDDRAFRQQLEKTFGPGAALVRLNSIPPETAEQLSREETSDLWGGGGRKGNCCSMSDRVVLRKYLASLVTSSILPALERRITNLNVIVSDRKKGVKNVFKSLWRTGKTTKEDVSDNSGNAGGTGGNAASGAGGTGSGTYSGGGAGSVDEIKYRYDSVESQTRLLADSLFLMKDYEAALSMYRLIKDDFKQDKAMAHYGSTQEMMALCMYLTDPYGKTRDIFAHVEGALLSYNRAAEEERASLRGDKPGRPTSAPQSTRLATRLCLILTSTLNICTGRHLEVADLLASASSSETALGAAVLLEQSSAHYFHAEMYRKYAFHMLMSGHMFRSAEQEHHAFRCFTSALYIYRDGKWDELHNHLRSALAAQLYAMGHMPVSLQLYAKLVGSTDGGRVSVKSQQKFMNHLLEICNEHTKKALVGADRMAAPAHLTGAERDAVRKERFERIVQVVRYTRSASRVLELPNIDLPCIEDSTLNVIAEETSRARHDNVQSFGDAGPGSDEVWDELMLTTIAELRAVDSSKPQTNDEGVSKVLATIEDPEIRSVIAQIDKEKANRNKLDRAKRSGSMKESPPVRAQMEPLTVAFFISNPLGIPIDLAALQLVARMTDEKGERICTNEDAVKITPLRSSNEKQKWTFHSSSVEFEAADFCRLSPGGDVDPLKQTWKTAEDSAPFFVVTKKDLTLDPESRRNVSASICPLVQGDLEILGVRCRLFDDVWVYHPFDVKGRLLQNTRSNRANRVRAESLLLKAKVERGMPCLTADLVPSHANSKQAGGPALQGQITEWTLRLSNVGTAAATSVTLKTNVPWVNIVGGNVGEPKIVERHATSFCVGPSSTLMRLPMEGAGLEHNGQIQPGETLEVPVLMRTSGAGKQEFYMLFRYDLMETPTSSSPRHRWLRKMFVVPVYPSLTLSASLLPSYSTSPEHILSVQLTNYRTDRPDKLQVILESLSLASRRYRLEPMPGQLSSKPMSDLQLDWRERLSVHYRVVALEEESRTCLLTECTLSGSDQDECKSKPCASSAALGFLALERAHEQFEDTWRSHQRALARASASESQGDGHPRSIAQIRRANTSGMTDVNEGGDGGDDDDGHLDIIRPTSIARLCPPGDDTIHISCAWKTVGDDNTNDNTMIRGEHHIRGLSVRPATQTKACPITVTAEHPVSLSNDFDKGPAMVPLEVTLRNRLTKEAVDFEFTVETPDTFDYIGPESFQWVLEAGGHVKVPLQVLIPSAGVYNLQHIRLTVGDKDQSQAYLFPIQWMVTVTDAYDI
jgi:uncharacterized membrane protein YgcG